MRDRIDTSEEFEPVEFAIGPDLDAVAGEYDVRRMTGEIDEALRERVRYAMNVRRASERIARGESIVPAEGEAFEPTDQVRIEEVLRAENAELTEALAAVREEARALRIENARLREENHTLLALSPPPSSFGKR